MALARWFGDPLALRDPFDDFFTTYPTALMRAPEGGLTRDVEKVVPQMNLDVKETDNAYEVRADVPGVSKDDIHVDFDNGVLRITAERKEEKKEENERWHVQERRWGSTTRAIRLPRNANPEDIQAKVEDGTLTIVVPKVPEEKEGRKKIQIA